MDLNRVFKMNQKLSHGLFELIGKEPILRQMAAPAVPGGPVIAVIEGKLVVVSSFVNPQLEIVGGAGPIKPGELVILEARLSNELPDFVQSAKIRWVVLENAQEKVCWTDGRKVIFGTGLTNTVISVGAKLTLNYLVDTAIVPIVCEASTEVRIGDIPVPDPSPDNNLTGIAQQAATWATALVDSDTRAKSSKALALYFKTISQSVGTGDLTNLRAVLTTSKQQNNAALTGSGVDPSKWDNWGKNVQDVLYQRYTNGDFKEVVNIKQTWWDISNGLYNCK